MDSLLTLNFTAEYSTSASGMVTVSESEREVSQDAENMKTNFC